MTTTMTDAGPLGRARDVVARIRSLQQELREITAEIVDTGQADACGYTTERRLLEDLLHYDPADAKRLLAQAGQLTERSSLSGGSPEPRCPATAAAAREGLLDDEHVTIITRTLERLADVPDLAPDVLPRAEAELAAHATRLAPAGLRRVADRLITHHDPDGVAPPDDPEPDGELRFGRRRRDGAMTAAMAVSGPADQEPLREVFDALSTPAGPDDHRTLAQRQMQALLELAAQALSPTGIAADEQGDEAAEGLTDVDETGCRVDGSTAETDDLTVEASPDDSLATRHSRLAGFSTPDRSTPDQPAAGEPPTRGTDRTRRPSMKVTGRALLAITMPFDWLRDRVGHGLLDSGAAIDPETARRLACDAGIVPTVLGTTSQPLDVGRLSYSAPDGIRRALHLRDGGCSFPGCTRRPKRCAVHHVKHWVDGGDTDIDNLTLLCRYHHHVVHHSHWHIEMIDGRPWYRPPRWIDPEQELRPGGTHPVAGRPTRPTPPSRATPDGG